MVELADTPDLGSGIFDVQVRVLLGAPKLSANANIGGEGVKSYANISKSLEILREDCSYG